MNINELVKQAYQNAKEHGFWEDVKFIKNISNITTDKMSELIDNSVCTRLLLINGEVSEAMEALRKNDLTNFREELADVAIRLFDLSGGLNIDLEAEITKKMEKNKNRPFKHGKRF